jgi:predicted nuclease with TOPRIM domain
LSVATEEGQSAREQMQVRLEELRGELEAGQAELQKLEEQRASLQATMLRISGAVQVLEELLAAQDPAEHNGNVPDEEGPAA